MNSVDAVGYAPGVAQWVNALRAAIGTSEKTLADFHQELVERGVTTISYEEMSRQLRDSKRYPEGPDERIAAVIMDSCPPEQRAEINALHPRHRRDAVGSARALVVGIDAVPGGSVETSARELGDVLLELNDRRDERVCLAVNPTPAEIEPMMHQLDAVDAPPDERMVHLVGPGVRGRSSLYFASRVSGDGLHIDAFLDRLDNGGGVDTLVLLDIAVPAEVGDTARRMWSLQPEPSGHVAVLGVVVPDKPSLVGRFSEAVAAVLRRAHEGNLPVHPCERFVPLAYLRDEIRRELTLSDPKTSFPQHLFVDALSDPPRSAGRFVRNRCYAEASARYELLKDAAARDFLDGLDAEAPGLDAAHYFSRAAARPTVDKESRILFSGRTSELATHGAWLREPAPTIGLRLVTGQPGVGKSALLGMIVCAAHPNLAGLLSLKSISRQPPGEFAAVHARGLLVQQVVHAIAAQLGMGADVRSAAQLIAALVARPPGAPVPTIVIDALDESATPSDHLDLLLLPLAERERASTPGLPACRLLVGTRRWPEFRPLIDRAATRGGLCDLDVIPLDRQRAELRYYLVHRLRTPCLTEAAVADEDVEDLATRIAADLTDPERDPIARGGPFLVAALFAHHIMGRAVTGSRLDPTALGPPAHLGEVLELELAERAPDRLLRPMLVALAKAKAPGIPERLLSTATAEIANALVSDEHASRPQRAARPGHRRIADLLDSVSFYLRRIPGPDGTTYYRFFHQALGEYMLRYPVRPPAGRQ